MSDQTKQHQQQPNLYNKPLLSTIESKPFVESTTRLTADNNNVEPTSSNYLKTSTNSTQPPSSSSTSLSFGDDSSRTKPWRTTTRPSSFLNLLSIPFPSLGILVKTLLGITVSLYILNQKHYLPKQLSRIVSNYLFWPTLPITIVRRIGKWETVVDDTVIMGGAPIGFLNIPEKLYTQYNVRAVINMCEEYKGPLNKYKKLGIESLHLPTVDHFEPSIADMEEAIHFIRQYKEANSDDNSNNNDSNENDGIISSNDKAQGNKGRVYVHCRAGHGRSAAVVMAWLLSKDPNVSIQDLNEELSKLRNVRKTLWQQPNLLRLHDRLKAKNNINNVGKS